MNANQPCWHSVSFNRLYPKPPGAASLPINAVYELVIKPLEEEHTPETPKPFQVALVEPVAYH